ncbi:c-type cytochrome biogenesis protein CcmF, partial [Xanthomonas oryzae pv. oryzae]
MSPCGGKQVHPLQECGLCSAPAGVARTHARQGADPMLPELGTFLLVLALLVALVQAVVPLAGAQRGRSSWM